MAFAGPAGPVPRNSPSASRPARLRSPMENYTILGAIGSGAFGKAFLVRADDDGLRYVLKKIRLSRQSESQRSASCREIKILGTLSHAHVVSYKEAWIERGVIVCLVTSYCQGGDLMSRLQRSAGVHFNEDVVLTWLVQLALALDYLHSQGVIHRDLKTANVFLQGADGPIRLGDFGLARTLDHPEDMCTTVVGTPNYMSPELLSDQPYNSKSDIWALGCVMTEAAALRPAFSAFDMHGLMAKILKAPSLSAPLTFSEQLRNLLRAMLSKSPGDRPSAAQILDLPWLADRVAAARKDAAATLAGEIEARQKAAVSRAAAQQRAIEAEAERLLSFDQPGDPRVAGDKQRRKHPPRPHKSIPADRTAQLVAQQELRDAQPWRRPALPVVVITPRAQPPQPQPEAPTQPRAIDGTKAKRALPKSLGPAKDRERSARSRLPVIASRSRGSEPSPGKVESDFVKSDFVLVHNRVFHDDLRGRILVAAAAREKQITAVIAARYNMYN